MIIIIICNNHDQDDFFLYIHQIPGVHIFDPILLFLKCDFNVKVYSLRTSYHDMKSIILKCNLIYNYEKLHVDKQENGETRLNDWGLNENEPGMLVELYPA